MVTESSTVFDGECVPVYWYPTPGRNQRFSKTSVSINLYYTRVQLAISVTVFNKCMWRGAKLDKNILVKQKRKNEILFRERSVVTFVSNYWPPSEKQAVPDL